MNDRIFKISHSFYLQNIKSKADKSRKFQIHNSFCPIFLHTLTQDQDSSIDLNNLALFQGPARPLEKRSDGDNNVQVNIFGRRWLIPNSYFLRNSIYDYDN